MISFIHQLACDYSGGFISLTCNRAIESAAVVGRLSIESAAVRQRVAPGDPIYPLRHPCRKRAALRIHAPLTDRFRNTLSHLHSLPSLFTLLNRDVCIDKYPFDSVVRVAFLLQMV
jgi:hypothetical protein